MAAVALWPHSALLAQEDNTFASWTDFTYTYSFNTALGLGGDAGVRGVLSDPEWSAVYLRPIIIYRNTDQLNFGFSLGAFQNFNRSAPNLTEIRPAQQVNLTWPLRPRWSLKSRLRFEERYLEYNSGEPDVPAPGWQYRARYELKFSTEPADLWFMKKIHFLAAGEYFFPLNEEVPELFADQSRLTVGYGQDIGQKGSYQLHFIWQRARHNFEEDFSTDQFILRIRLYFRNQRFKFVKED